MGKIAQYLYHHYVRYSFWDEQGNFRRGFSDGTTLIDRRIRTQADYQAWRERYQQSLEQEMGRPVSDLEIRSLSYLGVSDDDSK